jgi:hypothetical protein
MQDLIPMLAAVVTDPFALSHSPTLLAAITTLQVTMANCWPRLLQGSPWRDEIIKMLTLCWLQVADEADSQAVADNVKAQVHVQLRKTAKMLSTITSKGSDDLQQQVAPLLAKEPRLEGLFNSE